MRRANEIYLMGGSVKTFALIFLWNQLNFNTIFYLKEKMKKENYIGNANFVIKRNMTLFFYGSYAINAQKRSIRKDALLDKILYIYNI